MTVTFDHLTSRAVDWSLDELVAETNRRLPEVVPSASATSKLEVNARLVRHYTTEGVLPKPLKDGAQARYDTDHLVRLLALRRLLAEGFPSPVAGAFLARHDREALARFLLGELRLDLGLAGGVPSAPRVDLDHLAPSMRARLAAMRSRAGLPPLAAATSQHATPEPTPEPTPESTPARPRTTSLRFETSAARRDDASFDRSEASLAEPRDDAWIDTRIDARADAPRDDDRSSTSHRAGTTFTRYELVAGLELHVRDDFEDPTTPAAWNTLRDALLARLERIAVERSHRR